MGAFKGNGFLNRVSTGFYLSLGGSGLIVFLFVPVLGRSLAKSFKLLFENYFYNTLTLF